MLDWLIIGGGIHGVHLAFALTQHGVPLDRLRIIDPRPHLLARWQHVTSNTGMTFLRSPLVHHLHTDPRALSVFGRIHDREPYTRFIPTYSRPSLELFNRHCAYLIDKYHLDTLHVQALAQRVEQIDGGWRIHTDHGSLETRRVVISTGMGDSMLAYPDWAQALRQDGQKVNHLFEPSFHLSDVGSEETVVVIGGGISAVQAACALANRGKPTWLITRHSMRIHDFDSDPCWQNVLCLGDFHAVPDFNQRREIITRARHRGSIPLDVATALDEAISTGRLQYQQREIETATTASAENGRIVLKLQEGPDITVDRVLLATGFERKRPGGDLIDQLVQDYELPTARDTFPMVTPDLCWKLPGLHLTGPLAELEIGPASRNINGARMAGQRLVRLI